MNQTIGNDDTTVAATIERAIELDKNAQTSSAIELLARLAKQFPNAASVHAYLAWFLLQTDRRDEATGHGRKAIELNRHMRRILNQTANAAARTKGSIFEIVYRRSVLRLGHNQAIGAIAHRQCRLIWLILHQGVRYEERGPAATKQSKQRRTARMIRQLRNLGYRIEPPNPQPNRANPE